ncbi:MAG: ABC transporter permease [Bacteroidales bacterium]|jgi:molybdate/tungstate transport system permease protein|nr:ABC transporter permease [Bacteroidales bacterium]
MSKNKLSRLDILFMVLGGLVLLFIISPLLGMFLATTPNQLFETTKDPEVLNSIWLTLWVSFAATVIFAFGAIPLSYFLARTQFKFKGLINGIVDLPVVIPHSAAGIAILGFVSRDSALGKIGSSLGIDFVGHPAGIAVAMAFVSIPFLINAARDGFENVPVRLEKTALNLGASPIRVFFTISLPLAWKNVLSGLIMMFARGLSEFGAVIIIAYHPMITPVLIFERFGAFGLKYARPVSVVFIIVCLVFFVLLRSLAKERKSNDA